jgi:hypothetical protein
VKNLGTADKLIRVFLAELCILIAFFWMGQAWQIVLYLIAGILIIQAATGVCGMYSLIGWNTCEKIKRKNKNLAIGTLALMIIVAVAGSYASAIMTRNILIEDIRALEQPCNRTLQYVDLDQRNEAINSYEQINKSLEVFKNKYSDYRPLAIKFDDNFPGDMENISLMVAASREDIYGDKLSNAHGNLQSAGYILQDLKDRNGLN